MTRNPRTSDELGSGTVDRDRNRSRRTVLGAAWAFVLAAGSLFLTAEPEAGAELPRSRVQHRADKRRQRRHHLLEQHRAEQRRDRGGGGRQGHGGNDPDSLLDGFDLYLHNETGEAGLHVECGFTYSGPCPPNAIFNMGTTHHNDEEFLTDENAVYVWWANRFWIEFRNDPFTPVWIEVAEGGSARYIACKPGGNKVLPEHDMAVGDTAHVELSDRYFVDFRRDRDFDPHRKPQDAKTFQVWFRRHPLP
jgi:hypothetical protein